MPPSRTKRFNKKAQNSVFNAVLSEGLKDPSKLLNAIEFIEGPNGIGMVLRPVQRVVVKCLFGVPLDFKPAWAERVDPLWGKVEMWDVYREKLKATVTEAEYLQICHSEGRCNLADWRDMPEYGYNEGVVFAGRRSGKALWVETPIPTPKGWIPMGNLSVGDYVFDELGQPTRIEAATEWMHGHDCYRISFADGGEIIADADHQWAIFPDYVKGWSKKANIYTTAEMATARTLEDFVVPSMYGEPHSIVDVACHESVPVRCIKVASSSHLFLAGANFVPTHNSELVASIAAFKLYMLLNLTSPQKFFGLASGSTIDFTFLAHEEKGAARLFSKLQGLVGRANFFAPYLDANNKKDLSFITEADRIARETKPTITVTALASTSNAVRSPSSVFLALDEFAHFRSATGSTSEDIYAAATPATLDFHHKETVKPKTESREPLLNEWGELIENDEDDSLDLEGKAYPEEVEIQDSMILCISSPLKRVGKMYDLHKMALDAGKDSDIFTLNCPTSEMNIKVLSKVLRGEYRKNSLTFKCEYGGQFLDSSESYVSEQSIKNCTDVQWNEKGLPVEGTARVNATQFNPYSMIGRSYFWAFDLGMSKDAAALAIAHLEPGGMNGGIKLIYDYIDRMMVGEMGSWPGVTSLPGERKYENHTVLVMEDIFRWLQAMNEIMPCFRGATDQHGGQQLVQQLETRRIPNIELVHLTPAINSQMAYALRGYIESGLCSFPYLPKFTQELRMVELQVTSKYQIRVEAPMEKGAHDDMVDAVQMAAFIAQRWLIEEGNLHRDPAGLSILMQEQQAKPAGVIANLDGVSMTTLKVQERTREMNKKFGSVMGGAPVSPFFKRGRRR
jgi:hypothetical protein